MMIGLGATVATCPTGTTFSTAASLSGNTYPLYITAGGFCVGAPPSCSACHTSSAAPNADGSVTFGPCTPIFTAAEIAAFQALATSNPTQYAALIAQAGAKASCLTSTSPAPTNNQLSIGSFSIDLSNPVTWALLAGMAAAITIPQSGTMKIAFAGGVALLWWQLGKLTL